MKCFYLFTALLVLYLKTLSAQSNWSTDPAVNNEVYTGAGMQAAIVSVTDGDDGAIVVWDSAGTGLSSTSAQRINKFGKKMWGPDGVSLFQVVRMGLKDIIPDGQGGAIIVWYSANTVSPPYDYNVFALRINSGGNVLWTTDICTLPAAQQFSRITSDGSGGAIIAWEDYRNGVWDIYGQRINGAGQPQWTLNGAGTNQPDAQTAPRIISDGAQGIIMTFYNTVSFDQKLFAARIDIANGQWLWTSQIANTIASPFITSVVGDGQSGVITCWRERGQLGYDTVLVQRLDASGQRQWGNRGLKINFQDYAQSPIMVSDGNGGAIVAWDDVRNTAFMEDIYAQKINHSGNVMWTPGGILICNYPQPQNLFSIAQGANSGAIFAWTDSRDLATNGGDIYAQIVDSAGALSGPPDGVPISINPFNQALPLLVSDSQGDAIAVWHDVRNTGIGNSVDVYCQKLSSVGLASRIVNPIIPNTPSNFIINGDVVLTATLSIPGTAMRVPESGTTMTVVPYFNLNPPGLTKAIPRFFDLSTTASSFTAELVFYYTDQEIIDAGLVNGDANLQLYRYNGSVWELMGGNVDPAANTITITGVTDFSLWAMRDPTDTVVSVRNEDINPDDFVLYQNYPNPFNPSTSIQYAASSRQFISLKIYDLLGRVVATLVNEEKSAGIYTITFDAAGLSSGVYFYQLQAGNEFVETKKLVLLK